MFARAIVKYITPTLISLLITFICIPTCLARETVDTTFSPGDMDAGFVQAIKDFKTWFGLTLTKEQLTIAARHLIDEYYLKLKDCTPGKYQYPRLNNFFGRRLLDDNTPQPFAILNKVELQGFKDGKCIFIVPEDENSTGGCCEFSKESLAFIVEKEHQTDALIYTTAVPKDLTTLDDIMHSSCQANVPAA